MQVKARTVSLLFQIKTEYKNRTGTVSIHGLGKSRHIVRMCKAVFFKAAFFLRKMKFRFKTKKAETESSFKADCRKGFLNQTHIVSH